MDINAESTQPFYPDDMERMVASGEWMAVYDPPIPYAANRRSGEEEQA